MPMSLFGLGFKMRGVSSPNSPKRIKDEFSFDDSKGDQYRAIFQKVYRIIDLQFGNPGMKGIKGFIFHGEPGTGKTFMARMLAYELSVPLMFVDSSTIARKHYGESERQITKLFEEATHNRCILLFDDVESLFIDRQKDSSEGWNMDQNNVMFHQLDIIDTSRCAVILTTNLVDFLDVALRDRLYPIAFPLPGLETVLQIAQGKCRELGIGSEEGEKLIRATPESYRSMRAVGKTVLEEYVNQVERRTSNQALRGRPSP